MSKESFGSLGPTESPEEPKEGIPPPTEESVEKSLSDRELERLATELGWNLDKISSTSPAEARAELKKLEKPLHEMPPLEPTPEKPSLEEIDRESREREGIPPKTETQPTTAPKKTQPAAPEAEGKKKAELAKAEKEAREEDRVREKRKKEEKRKAARKEKAEKEKAEKERKDKERAEEKKRKEAEKESRRNRGAEQESKPRTAAERQERTIQDFEKQFGVKKEKIESIEGWGSLSPGQQALVLENLRQVTLGRIQEEGFAKTQKETAEAGFLGRMWRGVFKKYYAVKAEKATAEEIMSGGMKTHGAALEQLVKGMKTMGPAVEIKENGELEIRFAKFANASPEEQKIIDDFNKTAAAFGRTPSRWSETLASKGEKAKFQKQKGAYEEAKKALAEMLAKKNGDVYSMNVVLGIDKNVRFSQFLNTNPEAEEEIQKIQSKWAWARVIKSTAVERGGYMALGYATRALTVSMFGLIGAPLAAAGIGGWMARNRTAETLTTSAKMKKAVGKEREEILTFAKAENLSRKLNEIVADVEFLRSSENEEEREKATDQLLRLKARVDYTWRQVNMGLVDFGESDKKTANQYELIQTLAEAEVALKALEDPETENKLLDRLNKFMGVRQEKMQTRYKKQLRDQIIRGALLGAGFATAGYAIRHFFQGGEEISDADLRTTVPPTEEAPAAVPTESAPASHIVQPDTAKAGLPQQEGGIESPAFEPVGPQLPETPEFAGPQLPEESSIFEAASGADSGEYIETIEKGGSVWRAAEDQLEKHFGKAFSDLNEGKQTYIIDALKDKIVADPEKYGLAGITDPDQIPVGAKIDFSELLKDETGMEGIFGKAGVLSEAQVDNIIHNNEVLRTWVEEHPGERLSSGKVEEILSGGAPETATAEAIPAEAATGAGTEYIQPETGGVPTEAVQEAVPGPTKGDFFVGESGPLRGASVKFFYDSRSGLPTGHNIRGVLFGFNAENELKDGWLNIASEKLGTHLERGGVNQNELFGKVRDLEIIERISAKMPKGTPESRYLEMATNMTKRAIADRFGEVLKP